jgi:hypothetical protein
MCALRNLFSLPHQFKLQAYAPSQRVACSVVHYVSAHWGGALDCVAYCTPFGSIPLHSQLVTSTPHHLGACWAGVMLLQETVRRGPVTLVLVGSALACTHARIAEQEGLLPHVKNCSARCIPVKTGLSRQDVARVLKAFPCTSGSSSSVRLA